MTARQAAFAARQAQRRGAILSALQRSSPLPVRELQLSILATEGIHIARTMLRDNLRQLCREGVVVDLGVDVHRKNAPKVFGLPGTPAPDPNTLPAVWAQRAPLLGTLPDGVLARRWGLSLHQVSQVRKQLGRPAFDQTVARFDWSSVARFDWSSVAHRLGKEPDATIAAALGCSRYAVRLMRDRMSIPAPMHHTQAVIDAEAYSRAVCSSSWAEVATTLGCAITTVQKRVRRHLARNPSLQRLQLPRTA